MNINILNDYQVNNRDAQIIVDLQKTFSENKEGEQAGALQVPNTRGLEIPTNQSVEYFKKRGALVLASIEKHGEGHISFASSFKGKNPITTFIDTPPDATAFITYDEVKNWTDENNGLTEKAGFTVEELKVYLQIRKQEALWPEHAMVNTWESEFITGFVSEKVDEIFVKGDNIAEHTYSAFTGKNRNNVGLEAYMHKEGIGRAFVQSLTLDFCVKETALSSVKAGFDTYLIEGLSRGVYPNTTKDALEEMQDNGVTIIK